MEGMETHSLVPFWLRTQYEQFPLNEEYSYTWLINVPELFARRAPGNTCISAIENGANGTLEEPINRSKGCGGIMRVAPIGLYFEGKRYSVSEIDRIGAETAALTHGHELGYIPASYYESDRIKVHAFPADSPFPLPNSSSPY